MCDCLATLDEKLKSHLGKEFGAPIDEIQFQNLAFGINPDGACIEVLTFPFFAIYKPIKKDGSVSDKAKRQPSFVRATYCPFCGEKKS